MMTEAAPAHAASAHPAPARYPSEPIRWIAPALAVAAALVAPAPCAAQQAWVGVLAHGVDTPFTFETGERGADVQIGYRWAPERRLGAIGSPEPYVFASANSAGDTDFVAAGLAWALGRGRVFARPGIGIAVHDGPSYRAAGDVQTQLGSRVVFEPEISVGVRLSSRIELAANWTHLSHARLFGPQNPGLDMIGARLGLRLGRR